MSVESGTSEEQWYKKSPELYQMEIDAMKTVCPKASYGFLDTGQMYWKVPYHGKERKWLLLIVYDSEHPHQGRSIRCYPIVPNYEELKKLVLGSNVIPKIVPHCSIGNEGLYYLETEKGDVSITRSATTEVSRAFRWITYFEYGIQDQRIWELWLRN